MLTRHAWLLVIATAVIIQLTHAQTPICVATDFLQFGEEFQFDGSLTGQVIYKCWSLDESLDAQATPLVFNFTSIATEENDRAYVYSGFQNNIYPWVDINSPDTQPNSSSIICTNDGAALVRVVATSPVTSFMATVDTRGPDWTPEQCDNPVGADGQFLTADISPPQDFWGTWGSLLFLLIILVGRVACFACLARRHRPRGTGPLDTAGFPTSYTLSRPSTTTTSTRTLSLAERGVTSVDAPPGYDDDDDPGPPPEYPALAPPAYHWAVAENQGSQSPV